MTVLCNTNVFSQDNRNMDETSIQNISMPSTDLLSVQNQLETSTNSVLSETQSKIYTETEYVVLVDNSESMKSFDPESRIKLTLLSFVTQQEDAGNFSILIFDEDINVVLPLNQTDIFSQYLVEENFSALNYEGKSNNIVRAVERAVYELKYKGQQAANKKIILVTDGYNPESIDKENSSRLLTESILIDIAESNIELSEILLKNNTGLYDTQALGQQIAITQLTISDVIDFEATLKNILAVKSIENNSNAIDIAPIIPSVPAENEIQSVTQQPANNSPRVVSSRITQEEKKRSIIIILAAIILIVTLCGLIVMLYLRSRSLRNGLNVGVSEAYLVDIHGYTTNKRYQLGNKATMLGRVVGKDSENIDYIVIPETTIGRRHSIIEYKDYAYWIMDQGSINGTFVNNIPITSEVRLKHGDTVRLHKYEFEFSIPELDAAAMTKISNTVMAGYVPADDLEQESDVNEAISNLAKEDAELDFDFAAEESVISQDEALPDSDDETILPGHDLDRTYDADVTDDESLCPDIAAKKVEEIDGNNQSSTANDDPESIPDDATLIPGLFDESDEDATIRPNTDKSSDEFIDITASDDKK
ncbi:MAG: pSer/pThr/pTyr-binding forkhead associated (FHA) protein [Gammaproteobacteria bacterium]